jgi:hypothetical protein
MLDEKELAESIDVYFNNVSKEQFINDLEKAGCLHLIEDVKPELKRPAKFKNKYEALNYINEKYDVYFCEITCYQEANEFYRDLCTLYGMGKIEERDFNLAGTAMDMF